MQNVIPFHLRHSDLYFNSNIFPWASCEFKNKITTVNQLIKIPFLDDVLKYQQTILGFVSLAVHRAEQLIL